MNFAKYLKTIKLEAIDIKHIPIDKISCQFNHDRYKHWIKTCGNSFSIRSGPYWEYLSTRSTKKYTKLFKLYGRSEVWITNNILKFQIMHGNIANHGFDEECGLPIILEEPVLPNEYNSTYEIWEGHRRLSICLYLGIKQRVKVCQII